MPISFTINFEVLDMSINKRLCQTGIALFYTLMIPAFLNAQDAASCPAKPGIYAKNALNWTELPREADPVTSFKPNYLNPGLPRTNKEFAGERAFVTLHNPVQLCAVGTTNGASFALEKANVKKGTRTIVQVGDFHSNKGSQSQPMASVTDEQGNIHLMTNGLASGQYVLVMLGSFKTMPKAPSANTQADATTAMMESTTAMIAAMRPGIGGINFGIGIENDDSKK